ncbi:MAG: beta-galactosidase trimerization domain-containing protein [Actinobacteria bacterium]|nr:beta-galactosidase trimerization domain-containing protein [Actinomycetota bacterium]
MIKLVKQKGIVALFGILIISAVFTNSCYQRPEEYLQEDTYSGTEFTPPEDWEKNPQTYAWSGGPEGYNANIERALKINATVIGRGSWATSPVEWECLKEEISEAHNSGLIYLGNVNLLGLSEFSPERTEEYKELYNLESSEAVDINGDIIPHIVSEIGAVENIASYNLLDTNWQNFIKEISKKTIDAGADGIYYDDFHFHEHMIAYKGEFSELTQEKFIGYLKSKYTPEQLKQYGIFDIENFNYANYLIENYGLDTREIEEFSKEEWKESLIFDFDEFLITETTEFMKGLTEELKEYGRQKYNKELKFTGIPSSGFMLACSYFPFSTQEYVDISSGHITYIDESLLFEQQTKELFFPQRKNIPEYKIVYTLTGKPKLASVSDMSMPILQKQRHTLISDHIACENFIHLAMAEAFVNKGQFFDLNYPPAVPEIISKYNYFYLSNREVFQFSELDSISKVAVIYPATNYRYFSIIHFDHRSFYSAALALTDLNIQYDVCIAGDGLEYCQRKLNILELTKYKVIIVPEAILLSDREVNALLSYAEDGGTLIVLGGMGLRDENGKLVERAELENLKNGWNKYTGGDIYYSKDPIEDKLFYFNYLTDIISRDITARNNLGSLIKGHLNNQIISVDPESDTITVQLWQDSEKIYIHLLNYDYSWEGDVIKDVENTKIKLNFLDDKPKTAVLISPDFEDKQLLEVINSTITVPKLHIWDIVVIDK